MRPSPMSSARSATLTLELRPSRTLLVGNAACHLLALASLGWVVVAPGVRWFLALLLVVSLAASCLLHGPLRSPWLIKRIDWTPDGEWRLYGIHGEARPAHLVGCYVHPHLLILNFALSRFSRRSVVVLSDAADPAAIRRLRARLLLDRGA